VGIVNIPPPETPTNIVVVAASGENAAATILHGDVLETYVNGVFTTLGVTHNPDVVTAAPHVPAAANATLLTEIPERLVVVFTAHPIPVFELTYRALPLVFVFAANIIVPLRDIATDTQFPEGVE
jgi:hypothetical protein